MLAYKEFVCRDRGVFHWKHIEPITVSCGKRIVYNISGRWLCRGCAVPSFLSWGEVNSLTWNSVRTPYRFGCHDGGWHPTPSQAVIVSTVVAVKTRGPKRTKTGTLVVPQTDGCSIWQVPLDVDSLLWVHRSSHTSSSVDCSGCSGAGATVTGVALKFTQPVQV